MDKDPVSIDELRHDIDGAKRLAEQDRLEAEFKRDPDWDLVAECLARNDGVADLARLLAEDKNEETFFIGLARAKSKVRLAIEQCAREYAEKETT
jgi:hypothetical protein